MTSTTGPRLVPAKVWWGLLLTLLIAGAVFAVVVFISSIRTEPAYECQVTDRGAEIRAEGGVDGEHRPDARSGDRYENDSGCLPFDREIRGPRP